jgi:Family of unknown function (DUF5988)
VGVGVSTGRKKLSDGNGAIDRTETVPARGALMDNIAIGTVEVSSVQAVLVGGPASIPAASRVQEVGPLDEKVKLPHYGGYEHFERTASLIEDTSCRQVIFRWTTRTEMAE